MPEQSEPKELPISEFQRMPDNFFANASRADGRGFQPEYRVLVRHNGEDVEVRVTSLGQAGEQTPRDEKLSKYAKNPEALGRAIERAFQQAASGTPVKITTTPGWSGSRTAIIIRADMKG